MNPERTGKLFIVGLILICLIWAIKVSYKPVGEQGVKLTQEIDSAYDMLTATSIQPYDKELTTIAPEDPGMILQQQTDGTFKWIKPLEIGVPIKGYQSAEDYEADMITKDNDFNAKIEKKP